MVWIGLRRRWRCFSEGGKRSGLGLAWILAEALLAGEFKKQKKKEVLFAEK